MLRALAVVVSAATMILLSGCGTFGDMLAGPIDDHVFYRGVRLDVEAAKEGGSNLILLADLPFSAVADSLLVPFALSSMVLCPKRHAAWILRSKGSMSRQKKPSQIRPPALAGHRTLPCYGLRL